MSDLGEHDVTWPELRIRMLRNWRDSNVFWCYPEWGRMSQSLESVDINIIDDTMRASLLQEV
ncbi:hypothetical protein A3759_15585 [Thalassolituus sp. HI0120]|nr:hypothetical protein A3759_15585 [Thalassolituus sp. HI0120]